MNIAKQGLYCNFVFGALSQLTDARDPLLSPSLRVWDEDQDWEELTVSKVRRSCTSITWNILDMGQKWVGTAVEKVLPAFRQM